jgi:hypothetical protein
MKKIISLLAVIVFCISTHPTFSQSVRPNTTPAKAPGIIAPVTSGSSRLSQPGVALLVSPTTLCTGSLIGSKTILTAKHCATAWLDAKQAVGIKVNGRVYSAVKAYRHPSVDIAVLTTNASMAGTRMGLRTGLFPKDGQAMTIYGYGEPSPGVMTGGTIYSYGFINGSEFVAGTSKGVAACTGDSGGPVVLKYSGRPTVVGVTSRGKSSKCTPGSPAIFVSPSAPSLAGWIYSIVRSNR